MLAQQQQALIAQAQQQAMQQQQPALPMDYNDPGRPATGRNVLWETNRKTFARSEPYRFRPNSDMGPRIAGYRIGGRHD